MDTQTSNAPQIPNPPGGGSWCWNGAEWESLDPKPEPAEDAQAAPAAPIQHDDNLPES
jgi:hypothetical protein